MASVTVRVSCGKQCHTVTLKNPSTGQSVSAHTDSTGKAVFSNLAPAAYDMYVDGVYQGRKFYAGGDVVWSATCPQTH